MVKIHVHDSKSLKSIQTLKMDKDVVFFIYSKDCGPCHMFTPTWNALISHKNNNAKHFVRIEISFIRNIVNSPVSEILNKMMSNTPTVPNVAKYRYKTNRVYTFKKERTLVNLMKFC